MKSLLVKLAVAANDASTSQVSLLNNALDCDNRLGDLPTSYFFVYMVYGAKYGKEHHL